MSNILIVDDEQSYRQLLSLVFDGDGHNIRTASNGREALETEVEGKLDGVMTRIRALVFKKNGCTYTISHIGVPRTFEEDRGRFTEFLGNFQAP